MLDYAQKRLLTVKNQMLKKTNFKFQNARYFAEKTLLYNIKRLR